MTNGGGSSAWASVDTGLISVVILVSLIAIAISLLTYFPFMKRITKFFSFMGTTIIYALKGLLTVAVVGVPSYFLYTSSQAGLID